MRRWGVLILVSLFFLFAPVAEAEERSYEIFVTEFFPCANPLSGQAGLCLLIEGTAVTFLAFYDARGLQEIWREDANGIVRTFQRDASSL